MLFLPLPPPALCRAILTHYLLDGCEGAIYKYSTAILGSLTQSPGPKSPDTESLSSESLVTMDSIEGSESTPQQHNGGSNGHHHETMTIPSITVLVVFQLDVMGPYESALFPD